MFLEGPHGFFPLFSVTNACGHHMGNRFSILSRFVYNVPFVFFYRPKSHMNAFTWPNGIQIPSFLTRLEVK